LDFDGTFASAKQSVFKIIHRSVEDVWCFKPEVRLVNKGTIAFHRLK